MVVHRIVVAMATLATVLTLAACASAPDGARTDVDEAALLGTWVVDASFDSPEQPFVTFQDGGAWIASDGCNRVQGTWELGSLGALTTTAGPSTLMACEGAQLPLAVAQADYVQLTNDTLRITSSSDSTETTLIRSTDPSVGPGDLPVGQWVEADAPDAAFLTIAADGTVSGFDGCNQLVGGWTQADDGAVEFGALASTRKACDGVEPWLGGAATGRIQGGIMTIQDANGEVLGQLSSN